MTFIYKLDPYSQEIHRMCKYKLPTSRPLKVIIWQTDRQTSYMRSLPVTWQRLAVTPFNPPCRKPHATCKPICYRPRVMGDRNLHRRNTHSDVFDSYDLDLDPMTLICKSDLYCMEIYLMHKYKLPTSRLSKVIVRQTDV